MRYIREANKGAMGMNAREILLQGLTEDEVSVVMQLLEEGGFSIVKNGPKTIIDARTGKPLTYETVAERFK
jgi:hypothetical protein